MKYLLFLLATSLAAQCTHTLSNSVASGSAILVYRNGQLLNPGVEYTVSSRTITHLDFLATDSFSYVYDRLVKSGNTNQYAMFRENGTCTGTGTAPSAVTTLAPDQVPGGSGGSITPGIGLQLNSGVLGIDNTYVVTKSQVPTTPGPCTTAGSTATANGQVFICTPQGTGNQWGLANLNTNWVTTTINVNPPNVGTLGIVIPTGQTLGGLQWTFLFDSTQVKLNVVSALPNFNVQCGPVGANAMVCMELGLPAPQVLPAGNVATVTATYLNGATSAAIGVTNTLGATSAGLQIPLTGTSFTVH